MDTKELRALMNAPGPVGPSSPIVAAALVALPRLLDVVEAADRLESADRSDDTKATLYRVDIEALEQFCAAVAKWREGP